MNMLSNHKKSINRSLGVETKSELRQRVISQKGLVPEGMALDLFGLSKDEFSRLVRSRKISKTRVPGGVGQRLAFYSIKEIMDAVGKRQSVGEILKGAAGKIDPGVHSQLIDPGFSEKLGLYGEPGYLLDSVVRCLLKTEEEKQPAFMSAVLPGLLSLLHETFNSDAQVALRIISQMKKKEYKMSINDLRKRKRWDLLFNELKDWSACTQNNAALQIPKELTQYGFEEVPAPNGVRALSRSCAAPSGISIVVFLAPPYAVQFHDSSGRKLANPNVGPQELEIAEIARKCCSASIPSLRDFADAMEYRLANSRAMRDLAGDTYR